ncbi:MAG: DEAD/DEAH box helicase [Deltaproteobacteria bacterium]|nr:DEAD/DEAH box helicase [Deltaproteobacteria bacterium]
MIAEITIGKGVVAEGLPMPLIKKIQKDLTFDNPNYKNAMAFGKFISADMPSHLHLFEVEGNNAWVPRGYVHWLLKWMHDHKEPVKIRDKTLLLEPLNLKFLGELKEIQKPAIPDLLGYPCGVLEADTGAGKTVMAIYMIVQRQQHTLIIVHNKELLYQWQERIKQFTGEDCGLIGDGKCTIKPITVGIINSVRTRVELLEPHFGHIICDECHRITSESWAGTIQEFRAKYTLGLTATPFRSDGLGNAIFASIGPLRHTVDKKKLQETGAVLKPNIFRMKTTFSYVFANDYSTMISELINNVDRNHLIVNGIARDLNKYKENILIVSDRQKHLKIMQEMLEDIHGIKSHVLTGSTATNKRKVIIAEVRSGECKVLFATTSLIGEGFDAPDLTALFMGTPIKFSGRLIQAVGRILRPKKGKKPRLYDMRDNNVSTLEYSGYARDRVYKKKGW